jgi:hypothetical protein
MVRAVKLEGLITENRKLTLTVPNDMPAGPVDVLVVSRNGAAKTSLLYFLGDLTSAPKSARSPEEIEEAIFTERNAWE